MHSVRIVYPRKAGSSFNWRHYYDIHLPLGISLLRKHCGIAPLQVEVDQHIATAAGGAAPYHCICTLRFGKKEEVDAMIGLFDIEEARQQLAEDWPNYTEADPELLLSEIIEADPATGRPLEAPQP